MTRSHLASIARSIARFFSRVLARSLVGACALCTFSAPSLASGYGPSPYYRPGDGAPDSQRGISAQTLSAEQKSAYSMNETDTANAAQRDVENPVITAGDKH
jgi:hypothetical protein